MGFSRQEFWGGLPFPSLVDHILSEFSTSPSKGNQPRVFTGKTDAEVPILWPPDAKSRLTGKDPDAGKEEEKAETEDKVVR